MSIESTAVATEARQTAATNRIQSSYFESHGDGTCDRVGRLVVQTNRLPFLTNARVWFDADQVDFIVQVLIETGKPATEITILARNDVPARALFGPDGMKDFTAEFRTEGWRTDSASWTSRPAKDLPNNSILAQAAALADRLAARIEQKRQPAK